MATQQYMRFCNACDKQTVHIGNSTSHFLHLFLSLISFGAWLFVWAFVALSNNLSGACSGCGKKRTFG